LGITARRFELRKAKQFKALRLVLDVKEGVNEVTLQSFEKFLKWFGPVRRNEGQNFLQSIIDLLEMDWFHGDITAVEAENKLTFRKINNSFLVRYSQTSSCFTMSLLKSLKVHHSHITDATNMNLISYIQNKMKEHGLVPCKYARKFESLFERKPQDYVDRGYVGGPSPTTSPTPKVYPNDNQVIGRLNSD